MQSSYIKSGVTALESIYARYSHVLEEVPVGGGGLGEHGGEEAGGALGAAVQLDHGLVPLGVLAEGAEVHLAHNPLDTLREEEDFSEGTNYTSGAIHALEMLNQVGSK